LLSAIARDTMRNDDLEKIPEGKKFFNEEKN